MTFQLDRMHSWEDQWTEENPEPFPREPWTLEQVMARIEWHQKRWDAYRKQFPAWIIAANAAKETL